MILRKKQLQQSIISLSDDFAPENVEFINSLSSELRELNKIMKARVKNVKND